MRIIFNPLYQSLFFSGLSIIIMIINRFFGKPGNEWLLGALTLLLFELVNPLLGISAEKWWKYTVISLLYFCGLLIIILSAAALISKVSLEEYKEEAMIFLVIIYYPIMIAVAGIIRIIIQAIRK